MENLVGYAKTDLMIPQMIGSGLAELDAANQAAKAWGNEVNAASHSEICAIPVERLAQEQPVLGLLPSLRLSFERATFSKLDKLSCIRVGSARYPQDSKGQWLAIPSDATFISRGDEAEQQLRPRRIERCEPESSGGVDGRASRPRCCARARTGPRSNDRGKEPPSELINREGWTFNWPPVGTSNWPLTAGVIVRLLNCDLPNTNV